MATEIITAGSRLNDNIMTINLSTEVIMEQEALINIENANDRDFDHILISAKLYKQFVLPEQDLLAFSSSELLNAIANFDTAREHLMSSE